MLEKPDIAESKIVDVLRQNYALNIVDVAFLPLGADANTAVYRVIASDNTPYFLKLRQGNFDDISVTLPYFFHEQNISQIIAPLPTQSRALCATLEPYSVILYPFVEGRNGYEITLSDAHWVTLGAAFKRIHTAILPPTLKSRLPLETFTPYWRDRVKMFQAKVAHEIFADPAAAQLAAFLKAQRDTLHHLVTQAEKLAAVLVSRPLEFVACHADIHAGNVLIDTQNTLFVVDWDTLILAPKERDLMFVGGGLFANHRPPEQEAALFYQGYGQTEMDRVALAYYRYERIVQDIVAYCEQLLLTDAGGADREEGLQQLMSQFSPGGVIEIAKRTEVFLL